MGKHANEEVKQKLKAAESAIEQIKSKFGDGAIMTFGEAKKMQVDTVPTGCLSLDVALGVFGVPRGRIIEIYGPEASGKTTLAQHIVAEVQKRGGIAAFVDAEHALDPDYAKKIGVKVEELLISQPDTGEQALDIVETLVRSNAVDAIVIDSVAALVPRAEIEGDMGDSHMGLQARLMSQALRKLTALISKSKTVVVFINQTRMKIGIVYGNPETTTGGVALKFYSSIRIEVRRAAQIKQGDKIIGNRVKVKIVKNKVAPPFRTCEFDIMYNEGISLAGDTLDVAVIYKVVDKKGNSYMFEEEKLGVGREVAKKYLKDNPKLLEKINKAVKEIVEKGEMPDEEEADDKNNNEPPTPEEL
jgi:recombination protein RecA